MRSCIPQKHPPARIALSVVPVIFRSFALLPQQRFVGVISFPVELVERKKRSGALETIR
jgi:hypothetical protein